MVPVGPDNLVVRALAAVGREARVHLIKRIPPGAGLGGGSSNAAAVLRWAGCTDLDLAAQLGADVPFCLVGGRASVSGIGESVESLPYEERRFVLLLPPFGVDTAAVYRKWDELSEAGVSGRSPVSWRRPLDRHPDNQRRAIWPTIWKRRRLRWSRAWPGGEMCLPRHPGYVLDWRVVVRRGSWRARRRSWAYRGGRRYGSRVAMAVIER